MALNGRVLLLNQTYEPLGTVGVARAVVMLFKNSVFVEEWDGDRVLRTPSAEFPVPSVVRRRTYVNVRRGRETAGMKRVRIYIRDGFRCQYCGERKNPVELTLDHIQPRSRGGGNAPWNVVTACVRCNQRKGSRTPEEARMPLLDDADGPAHAARTGRAVPLRRGAPRMAQVPRPRRGEQGEARGRLQRA